MRCGSALQRAPWRTCIYNPNLAPSTEAASAETAPRRDRLRVRLVAPALARAVVAASAVINLGQFGAATIVEAEKYFSYLNALGSGDRTAEITVTTSGGTPIDSPMQLVNGDTTENRFWGFGPITIKFDLGVAKIIRQARWIQDTSTAHNGLFQWRGSNDNATYDDIGDTFNLGGSPVSLHNSLLGNVTAYRWYRLVPTGGASINGTPYLREVEFYIEGSIDNPPD